MTRRAEKATVAVPVIKIVSVEMSDHPCGDALLTFETLGDNNLTLILPMSAVGGIEAMLIHAGLESAKRQPKQ